MFFMALEKPHHVISLPSTYIFGSALTRSSAIDHPRLGGFEPHEGLEQQSQIREEALLHQILAVAATQ